MAVAKDGMAGGRLLQESTVRQQWPLVGCYSGSVRNQHGVSLAVLCYMYSLIKTLGKFGESLWDRVAK